MYRPCCKGVRGCVWTLCLLMGVLLMWRTLVALEGTLAQHGLNIRIPRIRLDRRSPTLTPPLQFLLEQSSYCSDRPGLLAVALVTSLVEDATLRQETRDTWGSAAAHGAPIGRVFLLGRPPNSAARQRVRAESRLHGDIVMGQYDDTDTASKALNGILWLAMHCTMVPFTIHATDKILLDVFLLQSFLWEVLESPEKQGMIFGKTSVCDPKKPQKSSSSSWSLSDLRDMLPEIIDHGVEELNLPYLDEGAWFGRTQAVAKLLGVSGRVPLVSPSSMYLTGLLASAAGLHKSPDLFNAWWRTEQVVKTNEIGLVLGWLNRTLAPSRAKVWELLKLHHSSSINSQMIKRDVEVNLTVNPANQPLKLIKYTSSTIPPNKKKSKPTTSTAKNRILLSSSTSTKLPLSNAKVVISRQTSKTTDPKLRASYLLRKKQLKQMMRTANGAKSKPKNKISPRKQPSRLKTDKKQ